MTTVNRWYEVRLQKGVEPDQFYEELPVETTLSYHHFWDEPWWPDAYVVRVFTTDWDPLEDLPGVDHVVPWDSRPDEETYGDLWHAVAGFFCASSTTFRNPDPTLTLKLVHCLLNSRGLSERDEAKFAARLLWNRMTIKLRWRLYLKRRWERDQRKAVACESS